MQQDLSIVPNKKIDLGDEFIERSQYISPLPRRTYTSKSSDTYHGIEHIEKAEEIELGKKLFAAAIKSSFPEKVVDYAYLTGGFTFGMTKSDIDILVVTNVDQLQLYTEDEQLNFVKSFADSYIKIHEELGYLADFDFPSDVITNLQVKESLQCRGFDLSPDGKLELRSLDSYEAFLDEKIDYRLWLWDLIVNRDGFVTGSSEQFVKDKVEAFETIVCYSLLQSEDTSLQIEELYDTSLTVSGLDSRYLSFKDDLYPFFINALEGLEHRCCLLFDQDSGLVHVSKNWLEDWEKGVVNNIISDQWSGKYIFKSWDTLRQYVKEER